MCLLRLNLSYLENRDRWVVIRWTHAPVIKSTECDHDVRIIQIANVGNLGALDRDISAARHPEIVDAPTSRTRVHVNRIIGVSRSRSDIHRLHPAIVILLSHVNAFGEIRPGVEVPTNDPRLRKVGHETLKLSHLLVTNARRVRIEVRGEEVNVLATNVDRRLCYRSLVAKIT